MRFSAEHRFTGPPGAVAAVLADPGFYEDLDLPDLSRAQVVEHAEEGPGSARLLLRYEYTGHLDPIALRLLGGSRLVWTQEVRLAPDRTGTLVFRAEANPATLHGDASFSLVPEGEGTLRRIEGEITVALPLVGQMAERRIVPGILARLEVEAAAVDERLRGA